KELGDTIINGQAINYGTRQDLWGNGGTGSMILTGLVGAASGNVTGSGASLLQNTAINVIRQYGATQIKDIADGFMEDGKPTAESETIRGLLHSIAGCAGAAATGGDCASAAAGSAATVALNNLIAVNTKNMTAEQKQSYSNLIASLVGGVTAAAGGDAAAAALASKIEVDNNFLYPAEIKAMIKKMDNCNSIPVASSQSQCHKDVEAEYSRLSTKHNNEMIAACQSDPNGSACTTQRGYAKSYIKDPEIIKLQYGFTTALALGETDKLRTRKEAFSADNIKAEQKEDKLVSAIDGVKKDDKLLGIAQ
ncbi:VENN motif pre-toxin domain-containing protein, partial [Formosimonas limnophila]|uniref:VENN motif pre-toxin domain-containing protein n=1 Tax=Formosimonas limnophila TaxID=1384487 RepID=UPI001676D072